MTPVVQSISSVGIVGAGIMGRQIARLFNRHDLPLTIYDVNSQAVTQLCDELAMQKQMAGNRNERNHRAVGRLEEVATEDLIIESATEDLAVKARILHALDQASPPGSLLATNTSSIPIATLADSVMNPERFAGIHFFHPVDQRALVEVIPNPSTSEANIHLIRQFMEALGKQPMQAPDIPGFVVNRLLFPYLAAAFELLQQGTYPLEIDRQLHQLGHRYGPLEMVDSIGLDTAYQSGKTLFTTFDQSCTLSPVLPRMVKLGLLGEKTGEGIYRYDDEGNRLGISDKLQPILDRYRVTPHSGQTADSRLLLPVAKVASQLMTEHQIPLAEIGRALSLGLGFPESSIRRISGFANEILNSPASPAENGGP